MFWSGKRYISPARYAYLEFVGKAGKLSVHCGCGVEGCVQPFHLVKGALTGEAHGRAKLSDADIKSIRERYSWHGSKGGPTQADLAKEFNVSVSNINGIINEKTRTT